MDRGSSNLPIHTMWQSFIAHPLAQLALLVTVTLGLLSILKEAKAIVSGVFHAVRKFYLRCRDKKVLRYMKDSKRKGAFYDVPEIATGLKRRPSKVFESLNRLRDQHKVMRADADEAISGLWAVHDLEE